MRAFLCSAGSEPALADELGRAGRPATVLAPGVVAIDVDDARDAADGAAHTTTPIAAIDPIFARQALPGARSIGGDSVRALAESAYEAVEAAIDAWPGPFTLFAEAQAEAPPGLGSRATLVGRELLALLATRRRRAHRRHQPPEALAGPNAPFDARWLLVQLVALERERLLVSAAAPTPRPLGGFDLAPWPGGVPPVVRDRAPPSRAYQKLAEAWAWMGDAPRAGQRCVDLGAAPGGWTATALKRGAQVVAVDRAPLAPEVARDPRVTSVIGNAFTYTPPAPVDWLLCDVICEPPRSLAICEAWLAGELCRNLVVTVKFKGQSGYGVLDALPALFARTRPAFARVKQLAHNKNEVTVMVKRNPPR